MDCFTIMRYVFLKKIFIMKKKTEHKKVFTKQEEKEIRKILKLLESDRSKSYRTKLRNIGFYISDFNQFTVRNFEHLIEDKIITITD